MNKDIAKRRVIVIGGSIAGLLAARVVADHFDEVTLIERDDLPLEPHQRRGVPHGHHAHAILASGQKVLDELFPGFCRHLLDAGALSADSLNDGTWFFEGAALAKAPSGTSGVLSSRPFLEAEVRRQVRSLANVRFLCGESVRGLLTDDGQNRVTAAVTDTQTIEADLIIDATGRGSKSDSWLRSLGYDAAREEKVGIDLVYTTRGFSAHAGFLSDERFIVIAPTPHGKRGGVVALQESGQAIVTLFGHFGNVAPTELSEFIAYAKTLPSRKIYDAIKDAEPVGEPMTFRFPASTRRHYQELKRFPKGFLVFGDAVCSFNPIYGQGMSVAALQAKTLASVLEAGEENLALRFFRSASKVIDNPWSIAVGGDLKMPETSGLRTASVKFINWYIGNVHKLAHHDPKTAIAFIKVAQLLEEPSTLMRPGLALKVLAAATRRKLSGHAASQKERSPIRADTAVRTGS